MRISELNVYPLKSGRGIVLDEAEITAAGIPGDREMMVVDPTGMFITQRELQSLARLQVYPGTDSVRFAMEGQGEIRVARPPTERRMETVVWKSSVNAALADDAANAVLSEWLGRDIRLVFFDEQARRVASPEWAGDNSPVTFADGYQVLVTTTGSLAALNADMATRGEGAVGMERFRPNIVLDHDEPWAEDGWTGIEIAGIRFDFVKPCARCIMTTQDQRTGSRDVPDPIPAMGRIRMSADRRVPGPLFGWNAVPRGTGRIRIGDVATVVGERAEAWAIKRRA
ncbi:MOSC domain-containing protein [Neorhizobium galegae bv. officinalis bv. officinalis str. HAMBI 1141]|uniref:MOSC domain-containing protein n=1 Tax=Neorhizobium galegae bv. officinalis bv. officinalis str. HAMBI 1141 TaxID=1028801 RepID=A0A068T7J8_NEOGA|nr:MOSC domain-containing protein [Neorhizobium galegae]CDN53320.1 MOSC domain-containing protein [Neorhizobium galegae bv. officinalis bv. officinalis str. HAMBI 1141]